MVPQSEAINTEVAKEHEEGRGFRRRDLTDAAIELAIEVNPVAGPGLLESPSNGRRGFGADILADRQPLLETKTVTARAPLLKDEMR